MMRRRCGGGKGERKKDVFVFGGVDFRLGGGMMITDGIAWHRIQQRTTYYTTLHYSTPLYNTPPYKTKPTPVLLFLVVLL